MKSERFRLQNYENITSGDLKDKYLLVNYEIEIQQWNFLIH